MTSFACFKQVLFERYGRTDAKESESKKRVAANAAEWILHGDSLVNLSPPYFTKKLGMSAELMSRRSETK